MKTNWMSASVRVSLFALVAGFFALASTAHSQTQGAAERIPAPPAPPGPKVSADGAIQKASADAQTHPSDLTWSRLGDTFMQKARETADLSYYGRAEGAYRKALARNPNYVDAMVGLAWVQGGRHEFEQSLEWARRALALHPARADAHGLIGDAHVEMGNYDDAFEEYQKMLDLRPDLSSYSRSAHLLFLTGDFKRAAFLMRKAIEFGGPYAENTAWCRSQFALMQFAEGSYVSAKQVAEEGLVKAPGNYHLLAALGKTKAALKDYPGAIESYQKAEAIVPQHEVAVALGDLYALTGKPAESKAQYALVETIRQLNKANGVIGDSQAALFYADHGINLPEALRMAEAEYKTRPNVYVADTLAWCYFKNGQLADARKYSAKALRQKTPEAMFLYHKGVITSKTGEAAEARTALYQALSLNPQFHPIAAAEAMKLAGELGSEKAGSTTR